MSGALARPRRAGELAVKLPDRIESAEELRLELAPGWAELALAAGTDSDLAEAKIVLGLEVRAEPDGEPHCDFCGRSAPPSGLEDQSLGGPPVHECNNAEDCQSARAEREPAFIDHQHPDWRHQWDAYQRNLIAWERGRAYGWYHPEQLNAWEGGSPWSRPAGAGRAGRGAGHGGAPGA